MKSELYYEAHVTVEPVFEGRLQRFRDLCNDRGFRVAELLMRSRAKEKAKNSDLDAFCTTRGQDYDDVYERMFDLLNALRDEGYEVWRYKIEDTLLDSRHDDSMFPIRR